MVLGVAACGGPSAPDAGSAQDLGGPNPDLGPSTEPRFARVLEAAEADLAASNATAMSIAVWLDEEIIHVGGLGTAGSLAGRAPDANTQFLIGSDSKKLTAITVLQRVEAGDIGLDAALGDVLPRLDLPNAEPLLDATVAELISHRGGVRDAIGRFTTETTDSQLAAYAYDGFRETARSMNPPGLFFNYSNPHFCLAGLLAEDAAGEFWPDVLRRGVLVPLGMTRTTARRAELDENAASGRGPSGTGGPEIVAYALEDTGEDAFVRPTGQVWSTPSDQMRLARFLVDGNERVLGDVLRRELVTSQVPLNPDLPERGYGYGVIVQELVISGQAYDGVPLWSHGGNNGTHTSLFFVLPEQRFAISVLSNGWQDNFVRTVLTAILELVELPEPTPIPPPEIDIDALDEFLGTYRDDITLGTVELSRQGDELRIALPDLGEPGVAYDPVLEPATAHLWVLTAGGEAYPLRLLARGGDRYLVHRNFVAVQQPPAERASTFRAPGWSASLPPPAPPLPFGL